MSKNEKRYENSVNDERCRRYFIYAAWLYSRQNNAGPSKDKEAAPAREFVAGGNSRSIKLAAFLCESKQRSKYSQVPVAVIAQQ